MPEITVVFDWLAQHAEFTKQYAHARSAQVECHVEEMLDVARQARDAESSEEAQGCRLLVDTLKWRASKMKPKVYGDKLTVEAEVNVRQMSDEELNARVTHLLTQRSDDQEPA